MTLTSILLIALMTFSSRAIALLAMPTPSPRVKLVLDRIPAPLFASLATISLIQEGGLAGTGTLFAAAGALVATPTRSLLWVLVGGLIGYLTGELLL